MDLWHLYVLDFASSDFFGRSLPSKIGLKGKSHEIEKHKKEHSTSPIVGRITNRIWDWELKQIDELKKVPFGSSCLAAAKST